MMNLKLRFSLFLGCLILGVLLGWAYTFFKPTFIVSAFSVVVGMGLRLFAKKEERGFITWIYFTALLIRIIATVFLVGMTFFDPLREDNYGALSGDEHIYMRRAVDLGRFGIDNIRKGIEITSFGKEQGAFGINLISIMSSIFYSTFGFSLFAMKILTCILGALAVVATYYISKKVLNIKIAQLASILVTFQPSLIRWSAQMLKEPFIIFLILIILLAILQINIKRWYLLIGIAVSLLMLYSLQPFVAVVLFLSVLLELLLKLYFKKFNFSKIFIFILGVFMLIAYTLKSDSLHSKVKRTLLMIAYRQYSQNTGGNSGYLLYPYYFPGRKDPTDYDFKPTHYPPIFYHHILPPSEVIGTSQIYAEPLTKHKVFYGSFFISYLIGLVYVVFSPFPWSISSSLQLQAYPQMIFNYFLMPFVAIGILICIRYKFKVSFSILFSYFGILSLLAITEGNVGALFRHRDWITPITLIFGAIGAVKVFYPSGIVRLKEYTNQETN